MVLLLLFLCSACKSTDKKSSIPLCVKQQIETFKKEPLRNPPAEVWQWETNNKTYFYINSPCCDQFNYLYSDTCEVLCAPDGGFTGKGDLKCPDFGDNVKRTLLWQDHRKGK